MQTANYQPTQPVTSPLTNNQSMEARKSFFFTHRQLILIGLIGGSILLFVFGLGIRAGEKRGSVTPTTVPITTPPSPSPTQSPTPFQETNSRTQTEDKRSGANVTKCSKDTECIICLFAHLGVPCDAGSCINGICVWPTEPPRPKK